MALFTPSQSPAVVVKEVDATGGVPNVQTSTGAIAIQTRWGPVEKRVLISNETELVNTFGSPDTTTTIDFHSASYFLRYSNALQVVRVCTEDSADGTASERALGKFAVNAAAVTRQNDSASKFSGINGYSAPLVKDTDNFNAQVSALDSDKHIFIARYPGSLGNSLRVSICTDSAAFSNWPYQSHFDNAPSTSTLDLAKNGRSTEVHIAVVDKTGEISGTKGNVLETYPYVSVATNSVGADGSTNYAKDVINNRSQYVFMVGWDSNHRDGLAGTAMNPLLDSAVEFLKGTVDGTSLALTGSNLAGDSAAAFTHYDFDSGANGFSVGLAEYARGYDQFENVDDVEIDFLITPGAPTTTLQTTVSNDLIGIAVARKDCVAVSSPARDDVIGQTNVFNVTNNIVSTAASLTKSSYGIMDGNFLKVYDKFNDQFIEIPAASSTAGLMAETDRVAAPWFSPAGSRRGQYLGVTSINYNPSKTYRDTLYAAGVNPVVNVAGSGVILYGDKTLQDRPSAFDRINVRRLFLTLERAIAQAAQNVMFEFNDEFTRAEFVNVIEPVLRDVKARRGITDFRVLADETVNTAEVIDRNEFIANIYIKPARSINFVTLNFVAVRTGVAFEEIVGTAGV
jgi:phage tail sheath protein FI